ncbi:putative Alpha-(1,3)-fucosyltransferase C [Hypsibius exemplaris]|uniref:Fucosyltransferase n=1 Tax=Hypsibius exemplaris TaxID=2072580 RepID=A0A1W0WGB8_HYPEX|nr:putative Alpha-(1,3)-fucosyltransferase C [Hypsibius exemplaris]
MDYDEETTVLVSLLPEADQDEQQSSVKAVPAIITANNRQNTFYCRYCSPPVCIAVLTILAFYGMFHTSQYLEADTERTVLKGCSSFLSSAPSYVPPPGTKIILFWNKFFGESNPYVHDKLAACRERGCFLTEDRRYLSRAGAVIFHVRDLDANDLPPCRDPHQRYVFFLLESPEHTGIKLAQRPWPGFFNLTWTYRRDSDVYAATYLEQFRPPVWTDRNASRELLRGKVDRALIYSSNCNTPSRREVYIKKLGEKFPVDVVGACGRMGCPKSEQTTCDETGKYKFYLAFENSICKDYLTEKVIRPLNRGTVPIVRPAPTSAYSQLLPPNSYIDATAFASPHDLAAHLWRVARNITLYEEYYEWKFDPQYAELPPAVTAANTSMCRLCEILHDSQFPSKQYDDLEGWWVRNAGCKSGKSLEYANL